VHRTSEICRFALAPPSLETSGMFYDSRVRYRHIYGLATEMWICVVYNWTYGIHFGYYKNEDVFVWTGAGPAPNVVKLIPRKKRSLSNFMQIGRRLGEWWGKPLLGL